MLMGNVKLVVLIFLVAAKKSKNRFPGEEAVCPYCFPALCCPTGPLAASASILLQD